MIMTTIELPYQENTNKEKTLNEDFQIDIFTNLYQKPKKYRVRHRKYTDTVDDDRQQGPEI